MTNLALRQIMNNRSSAVSAPRLFEVALPTVFGKVGISIVHSQRRF